VITVMGVKWFSPITVTITIMIISPTIMTIIPYTIIWIVVRVLRIVVIGVVMYWWIIINCIIRISSAIR